MTVEAMLLGIAQDGGVPQAGCTCAHCTAAHADPIKRQSVVCLGIMDHSSRQVWMIDATPDFREQWHLLASSAPGYSFGGILLTHAHIGHYTGLIHLGQEAWNMRGLPVYATAAMSDFLRQHLPWAQLVQMGNIALKPLTTDRPISLAPQLQITPLPVPHRNEYSDTMAYLVQGSRRTLFYCPDINGWQVWQHDLASFLATVDIALLDGSFWNPDELPGRDLTKIPHPFVLDTVQRLADTQLDCEVQFIHLNHSNRLYTDEEARRWLAQQRLDVGQTGRRWEL